MKIAVLLFGHLRTFEQCWQGLRDNLLSRYDCDVFIHTWDKTDHNTKSWHKRVVAPKNVDSKIIERLRVCYDPKDMLVEHQEAVQEEEYTFLIKPYTTVSSAGMHFMFESMGKANRMRKAYEERMAVSYDLIVVTRPDILLMHPLDLEETLYQAQICGYDVERVRFFASASSSTKHPTRLIVNKGNDMLFFAKPDVIDRYIETNRNLDGTFIKEHMLNVVSVYTAAEILAELEPVPISYKQGYDWMNIAPVAKSTKDKKNMCKTEQKTIMDIVEGVPLWKRIVRRSLWIFFSPIRFLVRFTQRHEWLLKDWYMI